MKQYKRKRKIIANSRDSEGCNDLRKSLNSSERQQGKRESEDGKKEYSTIHDKAAIMHMRWDYEEDLTSKCTNEERFGPAAKLGGMLKKLDIGDFNLYKCTCENVDRLSDEEILKYFGHL